MFSYNLMKLFIEKKNLKEEFKAFAEKNEEKLICKLCEKELGSASAMRLHLKSQLHKKLEKQNETKKS